MILISQSKTKSFLIERNLVELHPNGSLELSLEEYVCAKHFKDSTGKDQKVFTGSIYYDTNEVKKYMESMKCSMNIPYFNHLSATVTQLMIDNSEVKNIKNL